MSKNFLSFFVERAPVADSSLTQMTVIRVAFTLPIMIAQEAIIVE